MYPEPIQRLIELFSQFPTVGPRTASRFVFHLLKSSEEEIQEFLSSLQNLRANTGLCVLCFNPFLKQDEETKCPICKDALRDQSLLCVVEKESDLAALEKTKTYKGLYFILGGTLGQMRKEDIAKLRFPELGKRVAGGQITEIILALNPTTEGEATALYLERMLKPLGKKMTRLGRGLPMGGEVEYADEETLKQALEGRK
ncbi:MAG: recombination protein RecR [Candidatus Wildermuthbacteria bacterium]|nr:recombination protein RecR [Candidatus Wildermuthbacteria bacterium]